LHQRLVRVTTAGVRRLILIDDRRPHMIDVRFLALAIPILALAGCIEEHTLVKVKADGSGTLVITTLMKEWAIAAAEKQGMKAALVDEKKPKERATKLGEGVDLVSSEAQKSPDARGFRATYSFREVAKLRLKEDAPPSFRWAKPGDDRAVLTFAFEQPASIFPSGGGEKNSLDLPYAARRALLAGMKFSSRVEVDGKLLRTNSLHVEGPTVTLFEIDLDAMTAEEDRLLAAEPPGTVEEAGKLVADLKRWIRFRRVPEMGAGEAAEAMKGIPGLKLTPEREIRIEFAPR
jgi:hypothetical protein